MSQLANRWPFPDNPQLADFVRAVCAILNGGITVSNFSTGMKNTPKGVPTLTPAGKIRADQLPGGSAAFSTGDRLLCAAATAPTGWTQVATWNDRVLRVVSGAGAGTGGTWTISGLATTAEAGHTHTGPSHAHAGPSHTHTGPSHTHGLSTHTHTVDVWGNNKTGTILQETASRTGIISLTGGISWTTAPGASMNTYGGKRETTSGGTGTTDADGTGNTGAGGTGATGAEGTGATGSAGSHSHPITAGAAWRPAYLDVIVIEAA